MPWVVVGKNVYQGPLVILVDALSFSASEHFASGMQGLGRATIIGEPSPGGATGANVKIMPNEVILVHPVVNGLTADGAAIEGHGVIPEITVTLQRSQLLQGYDAQLQAAIDFLVEQRGQP